MLAGSNSSITVSSGTSALGSGGYDDVNRALEKALTALRIRIVIHASANSRLVCSNIDPFALSSLCFRRCSNILADDEREQMATRNLIHLELRDRIKVSDKLNL
jgi:hypothetical protein